MRPVREEAREGRPQFIGVHGPSLPAATWADRAAPGDLLAVAGPGGRMPLPLDAGPWIIAGDDSAIPAIGTLLDALPPDAVTQVYIETPERIDSLSLSDRPPTRLTWLDPADPGEPGAELHKALLAATIPPEAKIWVACEARAVRRIRGDLVHKAALRSDQLVTRGYWREGEADHPDGDYADS